MLREEKGRKNYSVHIDFRAQPNVKCAKMYFSELRNSNDRYPHCYSWENRDLQRPRTWPGIIEKVAGLGSVASLLHHTQTPTKILQSLVCDLRWSTERAWPHLSADEHNGQCSGKLELNLAVSHHIHKVNISPLHFLFSFSELNKQPQSCQKLSVNV